MNFRPSLRHFDRPDRFDLLFPLKVPLEFVRCYFFTIRTRRQVTVFGSARFSSSHPYYQLGERVGAAVFKANTHLMTGGGPGLMEAAAKGFVQERNGIKTHLRSLGINIVIPSEQRANPYLDRFFLSEYFFVRKFFLFNYSDVFIFLPGGFGTLDELAEAITLMRTHKILTRPIILVGTEFWAGLLDWFRNQLEAQGAIDTGDTQSFLVTDDLAEITRQIRLATDDRHSPELKIHPKQDTR